MSYDVVFDSDVTKDRINVQGYGSIQIYNWGFSTCAS
jgi:hypothetical protein